MSITASLIRIPSVETDREFFSLDTYNTVDYCHVVGTCIVKINTPIWDGFWYKVTPTVNHAVITDSTLYEPINKAYDELLRREAYAIFVQ